MKHSLCLFALLCTFCALTACVPVTPTLSPGQMVAAGQAALDETATEVARQTQQVYEATQVVVQATQDAYTYQQAVYASQTASADQATQQVAQITAQAATAQAIQSTQAAQTMDARHTDIAYRATLGAAQTADAANYAATQTAAVPTQWAQERQAALDDAAMHAQETAIFAQAVVAEEAAERERQVSAARAWTPFAAGGVALAIILILVWRWGNIEANRRRYINRDPRGDAPLYNGDNYIYDPDRNPGASMISLPASGFLMLLQALGRLPANLQFGPRADLVDQATTERDQMIDLAHRGLPDNGARRAQVPPALRQALEQPRYQIFDMQERPPQLDDETIHALESDWSTDDE